MTHRQARRITGMVTVVLVATLAIGCSDDDTDDQASSGDTTTSTTEAAPDQDDASGDDDPVEPEPTDPDPEPTEPEIPLLDVVDGSVAGHQLGDPAEPVIDHLIDLLGPPELDSGWQPSECPPADEGRTLVWGSVFVYFGHFGDRALDGARVDLTVEESGDAPLVRFPDGVAWGTPIDDVATAIGATAVYQDGFDWWEIWAGDSDLAIQYLAGPGAELDHVMLGYVPVCR